MSKQNYIVLWYTYKKYTYEGGNTMALIKCPECGKEFSDKAQACPNCGCPTNEIKREPKELPPEKQPEMFRCIECNRPIPMGIDKCIYCGHIYGKNEKIEEDESGITGRKNIECPTCGSRYIGIQNDIPLYRKIFEVWGIGTVLPDTKEKYRDNMIYICKKCGTIWNENKIIQKGEVKEFRVNPVPPVIAGILNIALSLMLIAVGRAFTDVNVFWFFIVGTWSFFVGVYSLFSINKAKISHISASLYVFSTVISVLLNLIGVFSFVPTLIFIISCLLMRMYEIKLS